MTFHMCQIFLNAVYFLINLNWKIKEAPMQVKMWRLMERKLACRKSKMINKDVQ